MSSQRPPARVRVNSFLIFQLILAYNYWWEYNTKYDNRYKIHPESGDGFMTESAENDSPSNLREKRSRWRAYFEFEYDNTMSGFRNIGESVRRTPENFENFWGTLRRRTSSKSDHRREPQE